MSAPLLRTETTDGITTLTMDHARRLNGWTAPMLEALIGALEAARTDPATEAVVLTGTGAYYSAGVNLGGSLRLDHPKRLHHFIRTHNQALFDAFLLLDKPLVAAVNGHAIGAPVTSATLCDAVLAAEGATFLTPFDRLGVPPEGCSSIMFPRLMGEAGAQRMLGPEGFKPTAAQALELGLIDAVLPAGELVAAAQERAAALVAGGGGRSFRGGFSREELLAANARESAQLADAFLSAPFLKGQMRFLWSKKKRGPAAMFAGLWLSSPVWRLLL
jgi:enoyl-CoA hydratase/carnithine racemase